MRLLIAVCCVVAWGGVAYAEGKHFPGAGVGASSCAEYAKAYRLDPHQTDQVYGSWAQGYISGVNMGRRDLYADMGAKTSDEMDRFLRKYCNDHPLANFIDAATELWGSLFPLREYKAPAPR
jgi:hypothetical protein